jgi:hypothetical protein
MNYSNETASNNGMHPTPHHGAFHVDCAGARVMPGVRSPESAGLMRGRFQARALGRSNKRMHATRDTSDVM